jgi:biopolymer transport protein ExbD
VAVGKETVSISEFEKALASAGAAQRPVFLRADQGVPYGTIVDLIARMRAAGVSSLGLVTEPPARKR